MAARQPPPKSPKTLAEIERINLYLRDNPTCHLGEASKITGLPYSRVRKWKSMGWIEHLTKKKARDKGLIPKNQAVTLTDGHQSNDSEPFKHFVGVVAPTTKMAPNPLNQEEMLSLGRDLKISDIRAIIKQHMLMSIHDSKSVNNYASALKSMSGVQDIELEESYFTERMVRVYCPKEDDAPEDVVEIDPIEY